jgi:hypothetical protein
MTFCRGGRDRRLGGAADLGGGCDHRVRQSATRFVKFPPGVDPPRPLVNTATTIATARLILMTVATGAGAAATARIYTATATTKAAGLVLPLGRVAA